MLSYRAESACMKVIKADARNIPNEYGNCGSIIDMLMSIRGYNCYGCGMHWAWI